jgi:hypothetical protein
VVRDDIIISARERHGGELFHRSCSCRPFQSVIRTDASLDEMILDDAATYIVVARHPLDAVADRCAALVDESHFSAALGAWIRSDAHTQDDPESFNGVFHHLVDAWRRRSDRRNVMMEHYDDVLARSSVGVIGLTPLDVDRLLSPADRNLYHRRSAASAPPDLLEWLHRR